MEIVIPEKGKFVLECNDWELEMVSKAISNFDKFTDIEIATLKTLIEKIEPALKVGSRYKRK